jgi:hypothetical protein
LEPEGLRPRVAAASARPLPSIHGRDPRPPALPRKAAIYNINRDDNKDKDGTTRFILMEGTKVVAAAVSATFLLF